MEKHYLIVMSGTAVNNAHGGGPKWKQLMVPDGVSLAEAVKRETEDYFFTVDYVLDTTHYPSMVEVDWKTI